MALSETFRREDQPWQFPDIEGFDKPWRTEREGSSKGGGGLCIYYKKSITAHRWQPVVHDKFQYISKERQWLLLDNGLRKCAFLHCYVACQSNQNDNYMQWNNDLFELLTQEVVELKKRGFMVVSLGDFNSKVGQIPGLESNTPAPNNNGPLFMKFISETNLVIMNTLPVSRGLFTRFMGSSKSILDYGLVDADNVSMVNSFIIDAEARFSCGSDHALLLVNLTYGKRNKLSWSFNESLRFNINENTDYEKYGKKLDSFTRTMPLHKFDSLSSDKKLIYITTAIIESGKDAIGLAIPHRTKNRKLPKDLGMP